MSEPASDATTPVPTVADPGTTGTADDEAGERGTLEIAFSVVRRIAEHAADMSEGTVRTERRVVGVGLGESGATARVSGYGDQVDLRLELHGPEMIDQGETALHRVHFPFHCRILLRRPVVPRCRGSRLRREFIVLVCS